MLIGLPKIVPEKYRPRLIAAGVIPVSGIPNTLKPYLERWHTSFSRSTWLHR